MHPQYYSKTFFQLIWTSFLLNFSRCWTNRCLHFGRLSSSVILNRDLGSTNFSTSGEFHILLSKDRRQCWERWVYAVIKTGVFGEWQPSITSFHRRTLESMVRLLGELHSLDDQQHSKKFRHSPDTLSNLWDFLVALLPCVCGRWDKPLLFASGWDFGVATAFAFGTLRWEYPLVTLVWCICRSGVGYAVSKSQEKTTQQRKNARWKIYLCVRDQPKAGVYRPKL